MNARWRPAALGAAILFALHATALGAPARIVHFPKDRSLGSYRIIDSERRAGEGGEARGDVSLPEGKALSLKLEYQYFKEGSSLDSLADGDLSELSVDPLSRCDEPRISNAFLARLSRFSSLRGLYLDTFKIDPAGWAAIAQLKQIDALSVGRADDEKLWMISGLPLKSFHGSLTIAERGWGALGAMTGLEDLQLPFCRQATPEGMSRLAGLARLKVLDLSGSNLTDECLPGLRNAKDLEILRLGNTFVTGEGARTLKAFSKLKSLSLPDGVDRAAIEELRSALPECNIRTEGDSPEPYPSREDFERAFERSLKDRDPRIFQASLRLTDGDLLRIRNSFASVESIRLKRTRISAKGLAAMREIAGLKEALFDRVEVGDAAAGAFADIPLEALFLSDTLATDASVAEISRIRSLKDLSLSGSLVRGQGIESLGKLAGLRRLDLARLPLRDGDVAFLREMPWLSEIDLSGTLVSDAVVDILSKLSRLRRAVLPADISNRAVQRLQESLPDCEIVAF